MARAPALQAGSRRFKSYTAHFCGGHHSGPWGKRSAGLLLIKEAIPPGEWLSDSGLRHCGVKSKRRLKHSLLSGYDVCLQLSQCDEAWLGVNCSPGPGDNSMAVAGKKSSKMLR